VTAPNPSGPTSSPRPAVVVHVYGRTDVGRTREHNEDAFLVADLTRSNATLEPEVRTHEVGDRGTLFMVADGMGGAAAGEIASAMAIEIVLQELTAALGEQTPPSDDRFATAIKRATAAANSHIHTFALEHPEYRGMGTTATVAGVLGDTIYVAQVGDSRAYLVRNGVGQQITKDQSLMQKLIEAGELTEEEAEQSERRNIILQALGPEATIKVDLTHQRVRRGDALVLCSDGLSGQVRADEITRIVTEEKDLVSACQRMIDRANEMGGPDNITVIVARFDGAGLADPEETDAVGHRAFPLATDSGQTDAVPERALSQVTTSEIPVIRRPTREIPAGTYPVGPTVPEEATMTRRTRGSLIALAFLLAFLLGTLWWVYRTAEQVVAPRHSGTATPTAPAP
jgi:serine/threonine protein phosphatase PrpC